MREYELTLILNPEVGEENLPGVVDKVKGWIAAGGGDVLTVTPAGRKRLAFPIGKSRDGNFFYLGTRMKSESLAEVERSIRLSEDILRHMVIRR